MYHMCYCVLSVVFASTDLGYNCLSVALLPPVGGMGGSYCAGPPRAMLSVCSVRPMQCKIIFHALTLIATGYDDSIKCASMSC